MIRHTNVIIDKGICYGQSELELTDSFITQAESIKKHLADTNSISIISSPSTRCIKLAEYISDDIVEKDDRLLEFNFGDWEMKNWDDIPYNDLNKWMRDYIYTKCPGGESFIDFYNRCKSFFTDLLEKIIKNTIIITHGGVIRTLISHVLKIPLENSFSLKIDFASVSKLEIEKSLIRVNFINRV
ncbi:MAG: alpha-ribazole phosphatase [Spirochaetota bacterium]|nr:alpha-ribazole phosphatase [Spirochaetota bacterium]